MKQLGIAFIVFSAVGVVLVYFNVRGIILQIVPVLLMSFLLLFIPKFKQILSMKIHWRLALAFALICTFGGVWWLIQKVMGDYQPYSMPVTFFAFGLLALFLDFLDSRSA